ncbi:hypothetical protein KR044_010263 [Drosophila immigrans]|nr:hypothetical protein KR044_010263 [Drosophila immigrans]
MEFAIFKPTKEEVHIMWSQVVTAYGVNQFSDHDWQEIFMDFCKCMTCHTDPYIGMDKVGELANELISTTQHFADTPRPLLRSATSVSFMDKAPTQPQYVNWREQRMSSHTEAISSLPMQNRRYPSVRNDSVTFKSANPFHGSQFTPIMSNAEFFKPPPAMQQQRQVAPPPPPAAAAALQQTHRLQSQAQHQQQRYQSAQQQMSQQQQLKLQQHLLQQQQKFHLQANPTRLPPPLPPPQKPPPPPPPQHQPQVDLKPPSPKKSRQESYQLPHQAIINSQFIEMQRHRAPNFVPESDAAKKNEAAALSEATAAEPSLAPFKKTDPLEDWLKSYPDKTASELASHIGDTDTFFESLPSASTLMETPSTQEVLPAPAQTTKPTAVPAAPEALRPPSLAPELIDKKSKKKRSKKSKN